MNKTWAIGIGAFVILAIGALVIIDDVDIRVSEETVQKAVDVKIANGPISSRGVNFVIERAVVDFRSDNHGLHRHCF